MRTLPAPRSQDGTEKDQENVVGIAVDRRTHYVAAPIDVEARSTEPTMHLPLKPQMIAPHRSQTSAAVEAVVVATTIVNALLPVPVVRKQMSPLLETSIPNGPTWTRLSLLVTSRS